MVDHRLYMCRTSSFHQRFQELPGVLIRLGWRGCPFGLCVSGRKPLFGDIPMVGHVGMIVLMMLVKIAEQTKSCPLPDLGKQWPSAIYIVWASLGHSFPFLSFFRRDQWRTLYSLTLSLPRLAELSAVLGQNLPGDQWSRSRPALLGKRLGDTDRVKPASPL